MRRAERDWRPHLLHSELRLTSWAGQYAEEGQEPEMIHTCFVAAVDVAEGKEPDAIWGGIKAGSDFFRQEIWTWPGSALKGKRADPVRLHWLFPPSLISFA
jgi:hypothetical protein